MTSRQVVYDTYNRYDHHIKNTIIRISNWGEKHLIKVAMQILKLFMIRW